MHKAVPFGFLNINKPVGMTSHDVVARVRRVLKRDTGSKKVGHAGTLDPLASGVLVVCIGQATRLSEYVMHTTKQYRATVHAGISTTTYDAEGEITSQVDASWLTRDDVLAVLPDFIGDIAQIPPMYSAIKVGGKKLYDLARAGETIERTPRDIKIHNINMVEWSPPEFVLDVSCSSGTYIRSLACDIGAKLATGAYLSGLVRTSSGTFHLDKATSLDTVIESDDWENFIVPPQQVFTDFHSLQLSHEQAEDIRCGRFIAKDPRTTETTAMAYTEDGHLLAVLENHENSWKPHKVFLPQT